MQGCQCQRKRGVPVETFRPWHQIGSRTHGFRVQSAVHALDDFFSCACSAGGPRGTLNTVHLVVFEDCLFAMGPHPQRKFLVAVLYGVCKLVAAAPLPVEWPVRPLALSCAVMLRVTPAAPQQAFCAATVSCMAQFPASAALCRERSRGYHGWANHVGEGALQEGAVSHARTKPHHTP